MATLITTSVIEIWNRALGRIGVTDIIQSETEARLAAEVCRRVYGDCRRKVLEAYHWSFATKQAVLSAAYGEYDSTETYNTDDRARYNGLVYVSLQDSNTGNTPASGSAYWTALGGCGAGWEYVYSLPPDFVSFIAFVDDYGYRYERQAFSLVANIDGNGVVMATDLSTDYFDVLEYTADIGQRDEGNDEDLGDIIEQPRAYSREFLNALVWLLSSELALPLKKDTKLAGECLKMYDMVVRQAVANDLNGQAPLEEPETPSLAARGY